MFYRRIINTAETPGTNRLEIVGEYGNLVYEKEKLIFYRSRMSMLEFSRKTRESFGRVESWCAEIPVDQIQPSQHPVVIEKFINAILNNGGELVAHGTEGVNSVIIANAIMLSSFTKRMVDIPFNPDEYKNILEDLKKKSKFVKKCKLM